MKSFFNEEHQSQPSHHTPVELTLGNAIAFRPKPRSARSYGISIKYDAYENQQPAKRIDYQVDLTIQQFKDLENTWQLCFNKNELFLNRHRPDLVSEQLANLTMKALYPVKVDVNKENEIFRGIVNHPDILKRWEDTAIRISEKYVGKYAELFIEKMNKKIQRKWAIQESLTYDMFWSVFFHPQYFSYEQNLTKDIVFEFPVFPYQQIRFAGEQVLQNNYTDYDTYKTEFNAEMEIPSHIKFNGRYNTGTKMKLNAQFDLDRDTGLLKHAVVNWEAGSLELNNLKKIKFSAYEIESNNQPVVAEQNPVSNDTEQTIARKKGFWENIFG